MSKKKASDEHDEALREFLVGFIRQTEACPDKSIRRALQPMVDLHTLVIERGRFFTPQHRPKTYRKGKAKNCFGNSFRLATTTGLAYCEGFVLVDLGGICTRIEHGWCADDEGRVVEVTLEEPALSYFGVTYTFEQMAKAITLPLMHGMN